MVNLHISGLNTIEYYDSIVLLKTLERRKRLTNFRGNVSARYEQYRNNLTSKASIIPILYSKQREDDFKHCYEGRTSALDLLKRDIKTKIEQTYPFIFALCQYCGIHANPSTFDHYLPMSIFPEYSVLSLNLVPTCYDCNQLKNNNWIDDDGFRKVVCLYTDTLPSRQYLHARIDIQSTPKAEFYLSDDGTDFEGLERVIRNHYTQLKLLDRFTGAASNVFGDLRTAWSGGTVENLKQAAVKEVNSLAQSQSPNHWRVALFQSIADSDECLQWLVS